jgi:hypothetical protein
MDVRFSRTLGKLRKYSRWDIRNKIFVRKADQISYQVDFVNYRNGALDSQPQLIKLTSCLFMVGGSLLGTPASSTTKTCKVFKDTGKISILILLGSTDLT